MRITQTRDLVAELASRVAVASGVDAILGEALDVLEERLPEHVAVLALRDVDEPHGQGAVVVRGGTRRTRARLERLSPDALPQGQSSWPARHGHVWSPDEAALAQPELAQVLRGAEMTGPLLVDTLRAGMQVLGSLSVAFVGEVDESTVEMSRLALEQVAPVIAERVAQARYQELEEEISTSFQRSMLDIVLEPDARLAVAVHYQAGVEQLEAGGDWYDLVPLEDGRIALMVGDVVGRSLAAATVMGRLRSAGRALLLAYADPAAVLEHLDVFAGTVDGARFATCCCVIVDPLTQSATYSTAGHPPALLVSPEGEATFLFGAQGPPLAVRNGKSRPTAHVSFPIGARVVLYTDGLVERRNEPIDAGLERLAAAAVLGRGGAIGLECGRLTVELFADFAQQDDVAIVCAQLISDVRDRFERRLSGEVEDLRAIRRDLSVWLHSSGAGDELASDVVLGVGEALANAIEHSDSAPFAAELEVTIQGEQFVCVVRDEGPWQERRRDPSRGRGLSIMRAVADTCDVDRGDAGTTVTMTFYLEDLGQA
jgi:serine phosphatase RsbU (regulator of sigma subunit)/anti-sigma regulatory factor (Ser/Thr protein kinase)